MRLFNSGSRLVITGLLMFSSMFAGACDLCGCFMGVSPGDRRAYAGMFYRYRAFAGDHISGSDFFPDGSLKTLHGNPSSVVPTGNQYEIYRAYEFRAKYFLHKRWEVSMVAPYLMNTDFSDGVTEQLSGLGDMTFLTGWQAFDEQYTGKLLHRLLLGAGVKAATGNFERKDEGVRYPFLFQTGTGTVDYLFYLNYQLGYRQWGLSLNPVVKYNGTNKNDEHVGDSRSLYASLFYKWQVNDNLKVVPTVSIYDEYTPGVYDNGKFIAGTKMNTTMAGGGFDVYWKNLGVSATMQKTIDEENNNSGLSTTMRFVAGISWYFSQEKFILHPKK